MNFTGQGKEPLIEQNGLLINLEMLFDTCGSAAEIKEMLDIFYDQGQLAVQKMEKAAGNRSSQDMAAAAHKIKSSLSIVQVQPLRDLAGEMEQEARKPSPDWDLLSGKLTAFRITFSQCMQLLQTYAGSL
jgi:HPt (histidine-containing phosphotransfer) domain-containing protein